MLTMDRLFSEPELVEINNAVSLAEDMVCSFFKMSANQWLRHRYDVKTRADLSDQETVAGPYAQIVRYAGRRDGSVLGSLAFDYYKICLQDEAVLKAVESCRGVTLFSFILYVVIHELVHIVRFAKFYQNFDALPDERLKEEQTVHEITRAILNRHDIPGMEAVLGFYSRPEDVAGKIY